MVSAGGWAARMSTSSPVSSVPVSTTARPTMLAAWRAISSSSSGSVAGAPSRRLNAPTRRNPSMRAWPACASARTRPASTPVMPATARNTVAATASCVLAMVTVWMGGMKKKSQARKPMAAV